SMPSTPAILLLLRVSARCCNAPAQSGAAVRRSPPCEPIATSLDAELDALLRSIPTHTAGDKLQQAIEGCRRFLFTFLANRAIPPTNNGSERALRPCVVFRKVTNCFRSEWAANLYADIRSVIETARRRAIGVLDAIRETLNGSPLVEMRALSTTSPKG
ncbi:MAG: transposase, partial [Rhodoplanes sp.]